MRILSKPIALVLAVSAAVAAAQGPAPAGPVGEARRSYENGKKNILASAEKMPADSFNYKPLDTADLRTFSRVLTHVTEAQFHSCGAINGTDQKTLVTPDAKTANKEEVVAALKKSFEECDKAFASTTDAQALELVQAGPAKRSRLGILWGTVSHNNEQYATLALYLRMKGIQPPSAEK